MMELNEENKLLRDALEQIARYQADGPFHARRTLAAIGPAAQPEGEAAPKKGVLLDAFLSAAKEAGITRLDLSAWEGEAAPDSVDTPALRMLLGEYFLGDEDTEALDNEDRIISHINTWHQAKLAEAREAQTKVATEWHEGLMGEIRAKDERAEKAEAEATRCAKEWADAVAQRQPAPQAGDALGSIDTPAFCDLITELQTAHGYINSDKSKASWATLVAFIDASRREAYDKGRAEGVGQANADAVRETDEALAAERLRAVAGMLGLAEAIPSGNVELWAVAFSVLGMIRRKVNHLVATPPAPPASAAQEEKDGA